MRRYASTFRDRVLAGLFRVVESIYSVRIVEGKTSAWHSDVRFLRGARRRGQRIGEFCTSISMPATASVVAWADSARDRRVRNGQLQTPVAYMTCNFPAPVGDKPALFTRRRDHCSTNLAATAC